MDSETIVNIMRDESKVEDSTITLIKECKDLADMLCRVQFGHIYREANRTVDYLANMGQQGNWGTTVLVELPVSLLELLEVEAGRAMIRRIR